MYTNLTLSTSERVEANLRNLCALGPRYTDTEIERAKQFILEELFDYGYTFGHIIFQSIEMDGHISRNNIIVRNFTNPLYPRVVVGAHYDTVKGTVGADDNGSGVAMLLELARQFKEDPIPVEFVFFVNEEPPYFSTGLMGSAAYFKDIEAKGLERYVQFINLDCVGFFTGPTDKDFVKEHSYDPLNFSGLSVSGDSVGLIMSSVDSKSAAFFKDWKSSVSLVSVEDTDLPYLSDLQWFYENIPSVHIADMALTRNHRIHSPADTPDTLDYIRMGAVTDGVAGIIQKGWK
jgi:hypothetical protein